jgi:uncharacterized protein (TIGR02270 family)
LILSLGQAPACCQTEDPTIVTAIPQLLSQHAEEAAFHWLLRDSAVGEPHYSLTDLAKLDGRLDAHLDGLRIAADAGWEIVKGELTWEEPGEVFTGALLAFESGDPLRVEEVLAVSDRSVELARGAISALGWLEYERAYPYLRHLLHSENPVRRRIAVGAIAVHRQDAGPVLGELVRAPEPVVRARALKAVGELGRYDLLGDCRAGLEDEDEECRFRAAWSGAMVGDAACMGSLQERVAAGRRWSERACEVAARRLELSQALAWHRYLAAEPKLLHAAAKAAGAIGDPALIPWLLPLMSVDAHARVAGEAFTTITGVDLAYEDLERDRPEGFESGPTDDPEDENVAMDPDEDLAWPDPDLAARWWRQNGGRFTPGVRYLLGQPMTPEALVHALRTGKQRQRAAAALEIAFRRPGKPLFEVRARGDWQRRALGM